MADITIKDQVLKAIEEMPSEVTFFIQQFCP